MIVKVVNDLRKFTIEREYWEREVLPLFIAASTKTMGVSMLSRK